MRLHGVSSMIVAGLLVAVILVSLTGFYVVTNRSGASGTETVTKTQTTIVTSTQSVYKSQTTSASGQTTPPDGNETNSSVSITSAVIVLSYNGTSATLLVTLVNSNSDPINRVVAYVEESNASYVYPSQPVIWGGPILEGVPRTLSFPIQSLCSACARPYTDYLKGTPYTFVLAVTFLDGSTAYVVGSARVEST